MKLTLVRTDQKNVVHVTTRTLESLMTRIGSDNKQGSLSELRRFLPMMISYGWQFKDMHLLPRVYPAVELAKNESGDLVYQGWNGLVLLTVGGLPDAEAVERAKTLAIGIPSTLAAFMGSSGKTVKILVRIIAANGQEPQTEDEADTLYRAGYDYAQRVYGGLFEGLLKDQQPTARASFRLTLDEHPLTNTKATALSVPTNSILVAPTPQPQQQRQSDRDKYSDYEFLYRSAAEQVQQEMEGRFDGDPHRDEAYMTALAQKLRLLALPEEEAVLHMRSHFWTTADDDHIRQIVASVYAADTGKGKPAKGKSKPAKDPVIRIRKNQQQMIDFLEKRYVFRYNTVMGYTEYRPNNTGSKSYMPVSERVTNSFAIECRLAGLDVWNNDIQRYVRSSFVPEYNPVSEYLHQCDGKWDGHDRIREVARRVPTKNPHWEEWFHTWFLGMVHQWQATSFERYGNQVAPLLISAQGWNKSTFIQSLLPPELQWGYTNQLDVSEKKQTLQAMSQFLLISLDEFNQISPTLQQGFLKNVITLPSVKVKRPYGKHVEQFQRMASFIGATNQTDVLTDPSGSRRFLGVELTGPIDLSGNINHEQLFAQALAELDKRIPYYFNEEQTQEIIASNRRFQQQTPAEQYFYECFEPAQNEEEGTYLTAAAIFARIKKVAGSDLRLSSLNHFGRALRNIPDLQRRRTHWGTEYLVKTPK